MKSNLRQILFEKRLSIRKLSKMTKLSQQTISKVYNNKFEDVTLRVIITICFALNCKIQDLISDEIIHNNLDLGTA